MGNTQSTAEPSSSCGHMRSLRLLRDTKSKISLFSAYSGTTTCHHNEKTRRSDESSSSEGQLAYEPPLDDTSIARRAFHQQFPEYQLTWPLDQLRKSDFARLNGEVYVDYMGGSLYPASLIKIHTAFLNKSTLGNTHSISNSSKLSSHYVEEARVAVLAFFRAPPGYTVVFTANATAALKLVGESFPFVTGSSYVLGADSHNSVHGIRQYAYQKGARVCYIESTDRGGFNVATAKAVLSANQPQGDGGTPSLFAMTGQSNITNSKNPLSMLKIAATMNYCTLLDAAALAPTSVINLAETPVDAMAVSFYKMFGFPTGIGALVVKESFLLTLRRPWFSGGSVNVVQVPGNIVTRAQRLNEQFEDGTINYLMLPSVTAGLRFLSPYLPILPLRLTNLLMFLLHGLSRLNHDLTNKPVVRILSRVPSKRLQYVGDQSDAGSIASFIFLDHNGVMIPNSFIEYAASTIGISLRTGCMCNPGGAAAIMGFQEDMKHLHTGVTLKEFEGAVGHELGVVRVSLGLATNFEDVWQVIRFAATIASSVTRKTLWDRWQEVSAAGDVAGAH